MADKRISQLVDRGTVVNNDVVPIVVSGAVTTNKATISSIQTFMQGNLDLGVTSVGITVGTTGTDVNVTGSPVTSSGNITINIPSASATNRGLVTTGAQTFAGAKTFNSDIIVNGITVGKGGASNVNNTAVGTGALAANTTGSLNTATGLSALLVNTGGNGNTANGYLSLQANTTGGFNVSVGNLSMYSNSTGSNNTAVGDNSLYSNSTGGKNTGIGAAAGYYIADGSTPNTTSDFSIYLGADTKASVDNAQNETVIGYNAIGSGSNTVTIGNSSVTDNYFTGTVRSTSLRLAAAGTADPTFFRNTSGTSSSTGNANVLGFNSVNNIFLTTHSRGGFVLDFNNSVSNRTYTLQDASGTLAFTSQIPTVAGVYLPLAGGTLTGALNGTSASFTGNIAIGSNPASSAAGGVLRLPFDNAIRWRNSSNTADVGFYLGGANLFTFDSGISVTGAATFSSSVTASQLISLSASGSAALFLKDASANNKWEIGHISNSLYFYNYTRGGNDLVLNGSTGAATFSSSVTASGVRSINPGLDGAFSDCFVGVLSTNNNETNAIQTTVSGTANLSGFRFQVSNGNGLTTRTSVVDLLRDRAIFNTNVGIGTASPTGTYGKLTIAGGVSILNDSSAKLEIGRYSVGVPNSYIKLGPNSNSLRFTNNTDLADIFTIDNGGNIGIGTVTPTNGKLEIQQSTTAPALWVQTGGTTSGHIIADFRTGTNAPALQILGNANSIFQGNVGIGTASPATNLTIEGTNRAFPLEYNTGYGNIHIQTNETSTATNFGGSLTFGGLGRTSGPTEKFIWGAIAGRKETSGGGAAKGYLQFGTVNDDTNQIQERMRITSTGQIIHNTTIADFSHILKNSNSSSPNGIVIEYNAANKNNTANPFLYCVDNFASTLRFEVRSNGGVANYATNNVVLSDERLKKDIEPLESYWDKFKAIEIVKYKYIDQTHDDFNIGVIAQQVEAVAPEFVDIDGWGKKPELDEEGNEILTDEEPLKSVYASDLHHATIKVLQEAMAKIEKLETEIYSLKNQIK